MSEAQAATAVEESYWATPRWAHVEIKGFRQRLALCIEVEQFGTKMLRLDIPENADCSQMRTEFYHGSSLHGITPLTEAYAKAQVARQYASRPTLPSPMREPIEDDDDVGNIP